MTSQQQQQQQQPPKIFNSQCYLMPLLNSSMDNNLSIDDRYVCVDDPDSQQRHAYQFDNLYLNHHEYMKSSYRHTVAPLVQQTIEGESTMVVFGGLQSLRANEFMLSNTVMQGVITPAAAYLLNAITSSKVTDPHQTTAAAAAGSVTFSWYKIQCSSPEVITDVLKTASTMTNSSSNHGNNSSSIKDSNSLVLRELGKGGRGMIIPGLWEVEIANSEDIEAVVNHLQKIIPEVADHSSRGDAHTVMQLTINRTGQQTNPSSHAATTVTDIPGLGRISFLLLSHLHSSSLSSTRPGSAPVAAAMAVDFPWVELMRMVLNVLQVHGSTPVFHKSRLLLLMKDVLLRRQSAAVILMLLPSIDQRKVNNEWLRLFGQLNAMKTLNSSSIPDTGLSTIVSASAPTAKASYSLPNSHPVLQTPSNRSVTPSSSSSSRSTTPFNRATTPTNLRRNTVTSSTTTATATISSSSSTSALKSSESTGRSSSRPSSTSGAFVPSSSTSHELASSSSASISTTVKRRASSILKQQQRDIGPSPSVVVALNTNHGSIEDPTTATSHYDSLGSTHSHNEHVSSSSNKPIDDKDCSTSHQNSSNSSVPIAPPPLLPTTARAVSDNESALQLALEASRREAEALKLAVRHSTDRYQDLKESHDALLEQLKEDGAFLVKRDQDKYRRAMKDLKDYEIYKEVMEATMIRMQQELELYAEEAMNIRTKKSMDEKHSKKHREFSESYSKDLVATKKKLVDCDAKAAALEKQLKVSSKERDVAVGTLSQFKSDSSHRDHQLRLQLERKEEEIRQLQSKLQAAEERCNAVQIDKEAILATNVTEIANLRSAHSKALEMLMSYQEENDLLRSAVSEMSDTVVKSNESILSLTNNSKSPSLGHHSRPSSSGHYSRAPTHIDDESASNNQYQSTGDTALSAIDNSDLQDRDDDDDGGGVEVEDLPPLPPLPPPSPGVS